MLVEIVVIFQYIKKLEILVTDMVLFKPQKNVLKNRNLNDSFTRKSIKILARNQI